MEISVVDAIRLGFGCTVGVLVALTLAAPILVFAGAFLWSMLRGVVGGVTRALSGEEK